MKRSLRALAGGAVSVALAFSLAACGGGGGRAAIPSANNGAPTNNGTGTASDGGTIGNLSKTILAPASATHVNALSTAVSATVDPSDTATVKANTSATLPAFAASAQIVGGHTMPLSTIPSGVNAKARSTQAVATNSPLDLNYFGGPVLGSAVSHDIFLNCDATCRASTLLNPGQFLTDFGQDEFSELPIEYFLSPGEQISSPLTGRYTKGVGFDMVYNFTPPNTAKGFSNPSATFGDIVTILLLAGLQTGVINPTTFDVDSSANHIMHIFLPPNVDTCLGTQCYSPDKPSSFYFCAYHSDLQYLDGNNNVQNLYFTMEPDTAVPGCLPPTNLPFPNQVGSNQRTDAQDSTLSHELFETITDPQGNAWYNLNINAEIGDLCAYYDNFVTLNGHKYLLQSEYSDIGHECISANLTNPRNVSIPGSTGGQGSDSTARKLY